MTLPRKFGSCAATRAHHESSSADWYFGVHLEQGGPRQDVLIGVAKGALSASHPWAAHFSGLALALAQVKDNTLLPLRASGTEGQDLWWAYDHTPGRSLAQMFEAMFTEQFPLAQDHSVLILGRIAAAMHYMSMVKIGGQPVVHGFLSPQAVFVTHQGEVMVGEFQWKGLTTDPAIRRQCPDVLAYASANIRAGQMPTHADDLFATGALFFEMLAREPLRPENAEMDVAARLEEARGGLGLSGAPIPDDLFHVLRRLLLQDQSDSFRSFAELKQVLDNLMNQGAYAPTTFNLALFMHTVFRGQDEADAKVMKDAQSSDLSSLFGPAGSTFASPPAETAAAAVPAPAPAAPEPAPVAAAKAPAAKPILKAKAIQAAHDTPEGRLDTPMVKMEADVPDAGKSSLSTVLTIITILVLAGVAFGFWQMKKKEAARKEAERQAAEAEKAQAEKEAEDRRAAGIFLLSELDVAPAIDSKTRVEPTWPSDAKAKEKVKVRFKILIDSNGRVIDLKELENTAPAAEQKLFLAAVEEAVMANWHYTPGVKDGKPVLVWDDTPYFFFNPPA